MQFQITVPFGMVPFLEGLYGPVAVNHPCGILLLLQ